MDIQAVLTTSSPTIEFTAPTDEYGRDGTFSVVVFGLDSGDSISMSRLLPAAADANGGAALAEAWADTGDLFDENGEFGMRSMGCGRVRLTLSGSGSVRVRIWR